MLFFFHKKGSYISVATPTYFFVPISPIVINLVKGHRLFLVEMCSGNHEFPDHEKNGINLDFLLLMSFTFIHEFPFFKIKQ